MPQYMLPDGDVHLVVYYHDEILLQLNMYNIHEDKPLQTTLRCSKDLDPEWLKALFLCTVETLTEGTAGADPDNPPTIVEIG